MPRRDVFDFLDWTDRMVRPECPSADARVDLWLRWHARLAWATVPSLIDHVGERSLIGHSKGRHAIYLAPRGDAIDYGQDLRRGREPLICGKALNYRMFHYLRTEKT
jgi:hypothetical protein